MGISNLYRKHRYPSLTMKYNNTAGCIYIYIALTRLSRHIFHKCIETLKSILYTIMIENSTNITKHWSFQLITNSTVCRMLPQCFAVSRKKVRIQSSDPSMLIEQMTAEHCIVVQIWFPKLILNSTSYPLCIEEWTGMHLHVCVWERVQGKEHSGERNYLHNFT